MTIEKVVNLIEDPINGPFYGEDFCIDDDGYIQINSIKTAALIMRKVNQSNQFDKKLVKIMQVGDVTVLGFDLLTESESVYTTEIGPEKNKVEVKQSENQKFCVYINGKRSNRLFSKITVVKKYLRQLDKELLVLAVMPSESED